MGIIIDCCMGGYLYGQHHRLLYGRLPVWAARILYGEGWVTFMAATQNTVGGGCQLYRQKQGGHSMDSSIDYCL